MASVDMQFVRNRKREIRRAIRRSSPVLIHSGELGIVIVAANKSAVRDRIGKVLDRMAVVSRGELTACDIVHKIAAGEAYALAQLLSRGDVMGQEPVQAVSALLSRHYHAFLGEPLAVETCIVQLNATPQTDYLSHIGPDGSVQLFERIRYLGSVGQDDEPEHNAQEALEKLNADLVARHRDYTSVSELVADLGAVPEMAPLFTAGRRRDIVVLDRATLAKREFNGIFKRLTL